jgi:hypothetical protein
MDLKKPRGWFTGVMRKTEGVFGRADRCITINPRTREFVGSPAPCLFAGRPVSAFDETLAAH